MLARRRLLVLELVDQHFGCQAAGFEGRPVDSRERGRQYLGELGRDHRDDGEVVGDAEVSCAEGTEQAGELPAGRDRSRALGL